MVFCRARHACLGFNTGLSAIFRLSLILGSILPCQILPSKTYELSESCTKRENHLASLQLPEILHLHASHVFIVFGSTVQKLIFQNPVYHSLHAQPVLFWGQMVVFDSVKHCKWLEAVLHELDLEVIFLNSFITSGSVCTAVAIELLQETLLLVKLYKRMSTITVRSFTRAATVQDRTLSFNFDIQLSWTAVLNEMSTVMSITRHCYV